MIFESRFESQLPQNTDPNGCATCHDNMNGFSPAHEALNCQDCHLGHPEFNTLEEAHQDMVSIPGNVNDMDRTCGQCHATSVNQIRNNLMTTNSGIVGVDRYVFGENDSLNGHFHIRDIDYSAADTHLRNLCARCHLGMEKTEFGPINQLSRGGGCNACHLNYSPKAESDLTRYQTDTVLPQMHPALNLDVSNDHCFGCHSRSGRISTNYQGYHETLFKPEDVSEQDIYKILDDERVFVFVEEDVHHKAGLSCIDCHAYKEVMGDEKRYTHEEEAVKIKCTDCHFSNSPHAVTYKELPVSERKILLSRKANRAKKDMIATQDSHRPLINTVVEPWGKSYLIGKLNSKIYPLNPPAENCSRGTAHDGLDCSACHTSWAPQCIGCHVNFEPQSPGYDLKERTAMKGTWREYAGGFFSDQPTLGVSEKEGIKSIKPAIPGMIMTLDQSAFHSTKPDSAFFRLFAPGVPHTISAQGRDCNSCHLSPLAIGFGRGTLDRYEKEGKAYFSFTSVYENRPEDGIPEDAWINFLDDGTPPYSTRDYFRPFNVDEQKRILRVGVCLSCHDQNSSLMISSLDTTFEAYIKQVSDQCLLPGF